MSATAPGTVLLAMDILAIFISAIFVNNIVLAQYLGNCPYLGCSKEKGVALGMAFLVPCFAFYGVHVALYEFLHILLLDYLPFLILVFSLFTVAGGVRLKGSLTGTPAVNTGLLAVGTVLASCMWCAWTRTWNP